MTGNTTRRIMQQQADLRDRQRQVESQERHAATHRGLPAEPYDVWPTDKNYWPPFPFPTFADAISEPEGWELVQVHFIDFDKDGAPIDTTGKNVREFMREIREGHGYAFLRLGVIAEYQLEKGGTT